LIYISLPVSRDIFDLNYREPSATMQNQNQNQNLAAAEEQVNFHDTCVASYLNRCSDDLETYNVVYHHRPREKDLARGHGPYDDTLQVGICSYHHNKILANVPEDEERRLPEIYGCDEQDALSILTQDLDREEAECCCERFGNNELHEAIIAYSRGGFEIDTYYHCEACEHLHPSWRDEHEVFFGALKSRDEIERMIENRPNMLLEQNKFGKTPYQIIPELIETLEESRNGEYVKYHEQGKAGANAQSLRSIMEMIKHNGGGDDEEEERLHPYY